MRYKKYQPQRNNANKHTERMGHATPKPVEMMTRIIKSSTPNDAIVLIPFAGTAPELIAAQNLSRRCYAMEISPNYAGVILERFSDAFPDIVIERIP